MNRRTHSRSRSSARQVNSAAAPLQNPLANIAAQNPPAPAIVKPLQNPLANMAAQNPPAPAIVKPAPKIPTPKFTDHEANGEGTKLLQEKANACFALCGAHEQ